MKVSICTEPRAFEWNSPAAGKSAAVLIGTPSAISMLSLGRDEDAELTGCGFAACFCADIFMPLPRRDPREGFRPNGPRLHGPRLRRRPKPNRPVSVLDPRLPRSRVPFSTWDGPKGCALLQQETQQRGSGGPRAASVERSHVMCEWSSVTLLTRGFGLFHLFFNSSIKQECWLFVVILRNYYQQIKLFNYFLFNKWAHGTVCCQSFKVAKYFSSLVKKGPDSVQKKTYIGTILFYIKQKGHECDSNINFYTFINTG